MNKRFKIKKFLILFLLLFLVNINVVFASNINYKSIFDAHFYADTYPELKATYNYDEEALYNHFILFVLLSILLSFWIIHFLKNTLF